jgi:hypothetical protein
MGVAAVSTLEAIDKGTDEVSGARLEPGSNYDSSII